ncbi:IS3 family transposase [Actinomyces bowdenii]|uniref:IS3 family transposase n=1 Tax=Actinomyces bowdenii TaxID=131109 RepID=A0A853EQV3_9ACTO|nr:IS3 family transposase [Actinomyces bowdenii]MBF0698329.1 IS3 family transposase [Actinomyces bowdenii]NYS70501.1 IS3 family transposase [Actinomyces bowdenii]
MSQKYELINREEGNYPISSMCRWSKVSRSGYYSWRDRPQSRRYIRRQELASMIETEFNASDGTYGYRRITARLGRRGVSVHRDTVRGLMRQGGLVAAPLCRKVRTTIPASDLEARPDLLKRDFAAQAPGAKWVGDITYIRTWAGLVYLATVLDCATKKVVGYAMADHMRTSLVCEAIDMAVRNCPTVKGETIFHSDRGSQYTSEQFSAHLGKYGIRASVGRTGVCWDNAWAESFNATLKNERVYRMVYPTRKKAMDDIASWIELTYNHTRLHSALGYRTPNEVERELLDHKQAA